MTKSKISSRGGVIKFTGKTPKIKKPSRNDKKLIDDIIMGNNDALAKMSGIPSILKDKYPDKAIIGHHHQLSKKQIKENRKLNVEKPVISDLSYSGLQSWLPHNTIKQELIAKLESQIKLMKQYLQHKLDIEDFHGVYDSAIDIRVLVAELELTRELMK